MEIPGISWKSAEKTAQIPERAGIKNCLLRHTPGGRTKLARPDLHGHLTILYNYIAMKTGPGKIFCISQDGFWKIILFYLFFIVNFV